MNISDFMTPNPTTCQTTSSLSEAARAMRDESIGDVLVCDDTQRLVGIVTDRDLVVRGLANGDIEGLTLADVCSNELTTVSVDTPASEVVRLMTDRAVRRVPVVEGNGRPVGIVSLGDLAAQLDEESALGQISSAPPDA
jgi:CBS domain-containing protein